MTAKTPPVGNPSPQQNPLSQALVATLLQSQSY